MNLRFAKKSLSFSAFLLAFIMLFTGNGIYAGSSSAYNWYCKKNSEHTLPPMDSEFSFINEYGGFYADIHASSRDKVIYLTFDAGYENGNVKRILDTLSEHNAHGAFFVLENLIKRNPELILQMEEDGHLVCNHTAKHPDLTKIHDIGDYKKQLTRLEEAYFELTGKEMVKIMRPPEGRFSRESMSFAHQLGYKTIFWSFAYADWDNNCQMESDKALEKILAHTHNGEIILLHPTSKTNADILDRLLTELEKEGYRFGTLSELWAR